MVVVIALSTKRKFSNLQQLWRGKKTNYDYRVEKLLNRWARE